MKKILFLFMALAMVLLGACSAPATEGENTAEKESYEKESGERETGEGKAEAPDDPDKGKTVHPGEEVLNAAGVRIVYLGLSEEDLYPGLAFEVENNGPHRVNIQTEDVLVNNSIKGFPSFLNLDPGEKQPDGHRQILPEDVDISALEKVTLKFIIFKAEPWEEIYRSEIISMEQF